MSSGSTKKNDSEHTNNGLTPSSPFFPEPWSLGQGDENDDSLVELYLNLEKEESLHFLPETPEMEDEDSRSETSSTTRSPYDISPRSPSPSVHTTAELAWNFDDHLGVSPRGMDFVRTTPSSSPRNNLAMAIAEATNEVPSPNQSWSLVPTCQTSSLPTQNTFSLPTTTVPACPSLLSNLPLSLPHFLNVAPTIQNEIPTKFSQCVFLEPPDSNLFPPNLVFQIPAILEDLKACSQNTETYFFQISTQIRDSPLPMSKTLAVHLLQCIAQCQENTEICLARCTGVESTFFLHAKWICMLSCQRSLFKKQLLQLELYKKEIEHCVSRQDYGDFVFAALFVMSSPFPCTIKQNQNVEPIEVRLLLASRTQIQIAGPVTAELVADWSFSPRKQGAPLQGNEENLNQCVASFTQLKFLIGTGGKIVHLKFRIPVLCNRKIITVESSCSEPFIVMTNTNQWDELQGTLLKIAIFTHPEVSAPFFCNSLHRYFLVSSRLDPLRCPRPLSISDMSFLFQSKLSKPLSTSEKVTPKEFDRLWLWLGPAFQRIRYHKFLGQLWADGLFWGFLTKVEAEAALQRWPPGTFLVRFSERSVDGSMALAYKHSGEIHHYLIQSQDVKGGQGKSLPQFLREKNSLVSFLKMVVTEGFGLQLSSLEKHVAMEKIGKRKKITDRNGDGYDKEVF